MKSHFMKNLVKNSLFVALTIFLLSCSDEFINQKLDVSGVASSAIIISPEWETDSYQFQCDGTGSTDFVIVNKPEWLVVESKTGKFSSDIGTITGKAVTDSRYAKPGIYIDQMLVTSGEKKYAVPVYYVTEGSPRVEVKSSFEVNYNNYYNQFEISNTGDGVLFWDIVSMPDWLTVNMEQFNLTSIMLGPDASASVPFSFDLEKAVQSDNLNGKVILRTNDKNSPFVEIQITANLGNPDFNIFENSLNFNSSETSKNFSVFNHGDGIVLWKIEGLPEWLTASPTNGVLLSHNSGDITISCDRSKLSPGLNTSTFYLKSSDPDRSTIAMSVTVRVPGVGENLRVLTGNIAEAAFDKSKNILYYVTGQPNKLIAFDVNTKTVKDEVDLDKAPTCVAFNDGFSTALVGHGGMISIINLETSQVTKTIDVNGILADIDFAANDWCAYTEAGNSNIQWTNIYWVNLMDGTLSKGSTVYENCLIKKVSGKDYMIGSDKSLSNGMYVFSTTNRNRTSSLSKYLGDFWFVGDYVIAARSKVFRISDLISGESDRFSPVGSLSLDENPNYLYPWWVDHSAAKQSVWAIFSYYTHSFYPPVNGTIYQFEDNDYTLVKTYFYDNYFQPDAQSTPYEVEARYFFANNEGTELSVLRKGKNNSDWSLEFIPIE
jgi:hypothetical protein